jgi:DNA-binding NtrC family response regulator
MKRQKEAILVVDDDKSILRVFSRILQKAGYVVETVETGKEALAKVEDSLFAAALIDMRLPDMDGTDLLLQIRDKGSRMVKILVTGFPDLEDGVKATDYGADAYLVKPIKPELLLSVITEKLKERQESGGQKS